MTTRPVRCSSASFALETLEGRTLLASPGDVLTVAMRQEIIDHWVGPNKATMQARLNVGPGAFDAHLLSYMTNRPGTSFFWNTDDVPAIAEFINDNLGTDSLIRLADQVVAHRFPNGRSQVYDVQLPAGDFDWTTSNSNPEFVHALNRHVFWLDLSQAYVLTGDATYVNELISQLSSWSAQFDEPIVPNINEGRSPWQPLDVALRTGAWTWVYQQVLGSAGWTEDANTLFVYQLYKHGDFLRRVQPYELTGNRALSEAQSLLTLAQLVPEFDRSADWERYGRDLMFRAMDAQLHPDGGHAESSPGYASTVILALLDAYWLDQKKGDAGAWSAARLATLAAAAKAKLQLVTPDSQIAAWSDTYRGPIGPFLNRPRVIFDNETDFPAARTRLREVWMFGPDGAAEMANAPVNPALPDRGPTYSMPQSGYYVMRSGADPDARQITFDAGPTGGAHGHFDLLSFELFGYGRPLISDPGLYNYDQSERRRWAISTPAHNTISIDNRNHAALEGVANANLWSSGISQVAGGYQVTARHNGYRGLAGAPLVQRSIWYDGDGVMLVADLGQAAAQHTFTQSFLLPGTNQDRDLDAGWMHSRHADGGNVKIQALLQPGQAARRQVEISPGTNVFTSDGPDADIAKDATRFYVNQTSTTAGFVTLITTYDGTAAPNISAELVGTTAAGAFEVQIFRDGVAAERVPFFARPPVDFSGAAPSAGASDVAWDASGRLHLVYHDQAERNLKYSVRGTDGRWSLVQTVDAGLEAGHYPSLALDGRGVPAVAYFDGDRGNLKFARLVGGAWRSETVDSKGSTGLYPSLAYHRDGNTAMIAYYHKTRGDLRLAAQWKGGWKIKTIDGAAGGNVGRAPSVVLDPNRSSTRIAIAYDDSTGGAKKFTLQDDDGAGWTTSTIDDDTPAGGGHTSLVYEPVRGADGRFRPAVSYYDASATALKFARQRAGGLWSTTTIASEGEPGLFSSLLYDADNRPNIFFHNASDGDAYRARLADDWTLTRVGPGGRGLAAARRGDQIGLARLDSDGLRVEFVIV